MPRKRASGLEFRLLVYTPFSRDEKYPFGRERRTLKIQGRERETSSSQREKKKPRGQLLLFLK